jgi:glycogen phosphorylase
MFKNKTEFISEFTQRIEQKYGRSVSESHMTEKYLILGEMIRDYASLNWKASKEEVTARQSKQMFYFSMEFLIGRLLSNNMMNLGIYEMVKEALADMNININMLEEMEADAGLGNGGLGRLAACFLDSLASTNLAGHGNCIRYEYGLFKQLIKDGAQVEVPDQWMKLGNVWEVRKPKHAVEVKFWGRIEMAKGENGKIKINHLDCEHVRAVPYDIPIIGHETKMTNTLRLWHPEASENLPKNKDFRVYLAELSAISQNVYPDDSTLEGRFLRLKQQYFFISAGVQAIIKAHLRTYKTLDNLPDKNIIQLNDTHPVLVIPELMRILMDEYGYDWDNAWKIVNQSVAYTNHTVMAEALEKWPIDFVQRLLPRIYMIVEEINRRHREYLRAKGYDAFTIEQMSIIRDGMIHMATLAIVASTSVNGVAKLHTEILKHQVFKFFYDDQPQKFNNKTNGITHRRWLLYSNPQLTNLLDSKISTAYHHEPEKLEDLMTWVNDTTTQQEFLAVKRVRKQILADYILQTTGIKVDVNSIFDVQAKRLHAYKRQMLNVMHIIYLYQQLLKDPTKTFTPRTFIFGAKSAPAYVFAKAVIKVIHLVANVVNNDPLVNNRIKVVFIPNYRVSVAEILMNAADVSEQISTAGKEASGTGNMKFMMNGAITLGTLDGANVEIDELVGSENDVIFGLTEDQVRKVLNNGHDVWQDYQNDPVIKQVMDSLIDGTFGKDNELKIVFDEIMYHNDEYLLLKDFQSYVQAQQRVEQLYQDQQRWSKICLINIAKSGYFSSDRTIKQYAQEIWQLPVIDVK